VLNDPETILGIDGGLSGMLPRVSITTACPSGGDAFVTGGLLFIALYSANSALGIR
jgi:hypothetical protein